MRIKPYRIREKDIRYVHKKGKGGREGHLFKVLPLETFKPDEENPPGPHVAQLLHITKKARKHTGIKNSHLTFELHGENGKCTFYFWVEDDLLAKKVAQVYTTCYPGIDFFDVHEKVFVNFFPDDWVCCAKLVSKKQNYMPTSILEHGKIWESFVNVLEPTEPSQRAVLQLIINPKERRKFRTAQKRLRRYGDTRSELINALRHNIGETPFDVTFRLVCFGREKHKLIRMFDNVLSVFNRLDSDCGGNRFKRKIYNDLQVKFLNAVQDRNLKRFVGAPEDRFLMGTTQLGHNFLALPTGDIQHLDSLTALHYPTPSELLERKSEKTHKEIIPLKAKKEMSKKDLTAEHQRWLELKKGWEMQYADQTKRQEKSIAPILKEIAELKHLGEAKKRVKEESEKKRRELLQKYEDERLRQDWIFREKIAFKGLDKSLYTKKEWFTVAELYLLRKEKGGDRKYLFDVKAGGHPDNYSDKEFKLMLKILGYQDDPDNPGKSKRYKYWQRGITSRSKYYYQMPPPPSYGEIVTQNLKNNRIVIGKGKRSQTEPINTPIPIVVEDLYTHAILTGGTGKGKTTLLAQMVLQLVSAHSNVFVFDPKGDLIYQKILPFIPEQLIEQDKVVLFTPDFLNSDMATSINLLNVPDRDRLVREKKSVQLQHLETRFKENFIDMIKRVWPTMGETPTLDKNLRGIIGACLEVPNSTIIDGYYIIKDPSKRWRFLNLADKEETKHYLVEQLSSCDKRDLISTENRLHPFFDNIFLKAFLCKRKNPLDFADLVKPGKLVLFDLSKSKIGNITSKILGTIYLTQLWLAVQARKSPADWVEEPQDFPTFAVLDEFQNFVTSGLSDLVSEARSYRFGMIMATQFLNQLDVKMRDAVLANTGLKIALSPGAKDAKILAEDFLCEEEYLKKLNPFTFYATAMAGSVRTKVFYGELYNPCFPPFFWFETSDAIVEHSKRRYAQSYYPADTSMFSADIKHGEDMIKALYTLQLKSEGERVFGFQEVKDEMERLANLPNILRPKRLVGVSKTCEAKGWIEVTYDKERARTATDKYSPFNYALTRDGIEKMKRIDVGFSAPGGGEKHTALLRKTRDFMLTQGSDFVVISQDAGGAERLPDGEVHVMPITTGRKQSDIRNIREMLRNKWIYKVSKGKDVNVEVESATIGVKDKIIRNLVKAMKQNRFALFVTETENNGLRVAHILEEFVNTGYKQYEINERKAWEMNAIPRKPQPYDYTILAAGDPWRIYNHDKKTFTKVQVMPPFEMDHITYSHLKSIFRIWENLFAEQKKKEPEKTVFEIPISDLYERSQKFELGLSRKDIFSALDNLEGMNPIGAERVENTLFPTSQKILDRTKATIESEEEREIEEREIEKEKYEKVKRAAKIIRKQLGTEEKIVYDNEEDFCGKVNATRSLLHFFLENDGAEKRGDGEIYISDKHLANIENKCGETPAEIDEEKKKVEEKEMEEKTPKKKRERKGLIADRIKEFFRTNEQKWYDMGQIAKALGMPPYSSSLHTNLKKFVNEKFINKKKKKNKMYFMRK